jgi:hypothetical protein
MKIILNFSNNLFFWLVSELILTIILTINNFQKKKKLSTVQYVSLFRDIWSISKGDKIANPLILINSDISIYEWLMNFQLGFDLLMHYTWVAVVFIIKSQVFISFLLV